MTSAHETRQEDWPELMRRAQDGDERAYQAVLRAIVPAIRACVRRRIADASLIEDVVQDTLLSLHKLRHTYEPARPLLPWVTAIAHARAVDALRRQGRTRNREVREESMLAEIADAGALSALEASGARGDMGRLLRALPDRQRMVVEMVKLREMSLADAAAESRLSVPAVKSLLHRAFARLAHLGARIHD